MQSYSPHRLLLCMTEREERRERDKLAMLKVKRGFESSRIKGTEKGCKFQIDFKKKKQGLTHQPNNTINIILLPLIQAYKNVVKNM